MAYNIEEVQIIELYCYNKTLSIPAAYINKKQKTEIELKPTHLILAKSNIPLQKHELTKVLHLIKRCTYNIISLFVFNN